MHTESGTGEKRYVRARVACENPRMRRFVPPSSACFKREKKRLYAVYLVARLSQSSKRALFCSLNDCDNKNPREKHSMLH